MASDNYPINELWLGDTAPSVAIGGVWFLHSGTGRLIYTGNAGSTPVTVTAAVEAHHTSHESGGGDAIKLDDLAAPDDNTDLNVSTTKHGLAPKAPNDATKFLRGDVTWAVPTFTETAYDVTSFSFLITNPSAGLTNAEVVSAAGVAGSYHTLPTACTVVGIAWQFTGAHTTGTAVFRARKNGTAENSLSHNTGTTETSGYTAGSGGSFSAGDTLGADITTDVSWNGTTGTARVDIWVRATRF